MDLSPQIILFSSFGTRKKPCSHIVISIGLLLQLVPRRNFIKGIVPGRNNWLTLSKILPSCKKKKKINK